MTFTVETRLNEFAELGIDPADHYLASRAQIIGIHKQSVLHNCAENLLLGLTLETRLIEFDIHDSQCAEDYGPDSPGHRKLWWEGPLTELLAAEVLPEVTETIRAVHMHVRAPDFSIHSLVCEPEGYIHTSVTAPVAFHPLPMVGMDCSDALVMAAVRICQHPDVWGRAWDHIPCYHPASQDPSEHGHEEE